MGRYLISFDRGWMNISAEDLPAVAEAANAVIEEAMAAGVFVFGGGIEDDEPTTLVGVDGTVTDGPFIETKEMVGGFFLLDGVDRDEAIAIAGRCPAAEWATVEVRALGPCYDESRAPATASS